MRHKGDAKAAATLWESSDVDLWQSCSRRYAALAETASRGNVQIGKSCYKDAHRRLESLRARLAELKTSPELGLEDLLAVRDWKMALNKWRPSGAIVGQNTDDAKVRETTRLAFAELDAGPGTWPSCERALRILCEDKGTKLKGLGPATASLVLSLRDPNVPFFGEAVLEAAHAKTGRYDMRAYREFHGLVQRRLEQLHAAAASSSLGDWTCLSLCQAVWAAAFGALEHDTPKREGCEDAPRSGSKTPRRDVSRARSGGDAGACAGTAEEVGSVATDELHQRPTEKKRRRVEVKGKDDGGGG